MLDLLRDLTVPLRVPRDAERDADFHAVIVRHTRWGMLLAAALGAVGSAMFVGMQVASGRHLALVYPDVPDAAVVVADEVLIVALCLALVAAARRERLVSRWGRPLLAAVLVTAATASMLDDAARGDYTFSIAWAGLMAVVAVAAVPFRPAQAAAMWAAVGAVFGGLLLLWPDAVASQFAVDRVAYAAFTAVVLTCLSALLYAGRYRQHQAFRRADALRASLTERTADLEASLEELAAAQERAAYAERMAALGQFSSGLAHELQNPLNFVTNFAELSQEMIEDVGGAIRDGDLDVAVADLDDLAENAARIHRHGERMSRIVRQMRDHTGERKPPVPVEVNALVRRTALSVYDAGGALGEVALDFDLCPDLPRVAASPLDLARAVAGVVENALLAAAEGGGPPQVSVETRGGPGHVTIRVSDNGPGIPAAAAGHVFEPFFTTRPTGEGIGLGLSLAYDAVVQGHGGDLRFETEPGGGTTFVVEVPHAVPLDRAPPAADRAPAAQAVA